MYDYTVPIRLKGGNGGTAWNVSKKKNNRIVKKTLLIVGAVLFLFAICVLLLITHQWNDAAEEYDVSNPLITAYGKTMVSAHRSGGGIFPENTMMAFENCILSTEFQTDIFEFDLHITKDKELIILHDDTLDRTTNSESVFGVKKARPENYTLEELRLLNFGDGFVDDNGLMPYHGLAETDVPNSLRVATLNDVLDFLQFAGEFKYIIEIKNHGKLGYEAADRLYEILKARDLLADVVVGTFNAEITAYLDAQYPDMLRSASIKEVIAFYLDSLLDRSRPVGYYRFKALQIPANQFVIRLGNAKLVNYAHKNDIAVQYWTINEAEDIRMLQNIGADCVMSDDPALAYRVINGSE